MARARRTGFTLIELMLALALMGLVFLGMTLLLDQLVDARVRTVAEMDRANGAANGDRVLRSLLENVVAGDSTSIFVGSRDATTFATWCDAPGGWLERCSAELRVVVGEDSSWVDIVLGHVQPVTALRLAGRLSLTYRAPTAPFTPAAFGLVTSTDTIVFRVGGAQ
jgi:prepilin-type N-terminal cleavage/methylation domain-containing protein